MHLFRKEAQIDDSKLESASQKAMASLVKSMPEEDLSLSWRSDLNVKLLAVQQAKKKQKASRRFLALGSSLSFGAAAACFAIIMVQNGPQNLSPNVADRSGLASELVQAHQESVVLANVSGTGSAAHESAYINDSYSYQDDLL